MKRPPSQIELIEESFWNVTKSPILRGAIGAGNALVRGAAKTLDYVDPRLTDPYHKTKKFVKDVGYEMRKGWDKGYGGKEKVVKDILLDIGFEYVAGSLTKTGRNYVAMGKEIEGHDDGGNPIVSMKNRRILLDKDMNILRVEGRGHSYKKAIGPNL